MNKYFNMFRGLNSKKRVQLIKKLKIKLIYAKNHMFNGANHKFPIQIDYPESDMTIDEGLRHLCSRVPFEYWKKY